MDEEQSRKIIENMSKGLDPATGAKLPPDSAYCAPEVIRALVIAALAMRRRRNKPANTGKPWTREEDATLVAAFEKETPAIEIAAKLARSRFAVEQRLIKLGKMARPTHGGRYHDKAEEELAVY